MSDTSSSNVGGKPRVGNHLNVGRGGLTGHVTNQIAVLKKIINCSIVLQQLDSMKKMGSEGQGNLSIQ